jgi:site-specific DNA-cytosine methylase
MKPIRVVSLFCGAGFSDFALHRASDATGIPVEVVLAVDSWDRAVTVYNANLPSRAIVGDVKTMTREDLPAHDLVIGGPPCQPFSSAGRGLGHDDPRNCLPDFLRLSTGSAYLMENVKARLIPQSWCEQFDASNFGDVTTRRRWFYSDHLLHVAHTPGPLRVRDCREPGRDDPKRDRSFYMRSHGVTARPIPDDGFFGSFTATSWHGVQNASSSSRLVTMPLGGYRCPSLLEMQRAHSIPESWSWFNATSTDRGKMIANGWPIGMGTAVLSAMLRAVARSKEIAA